VETPFPYAGEIAAIATATCWAFTAIAFESAGKRVGSLAVNQIRLVIAFLLLSAMCWITRGTPLPTDATAHNWIWLGASGIVGFTLGDLCLFRALVEIGSRVSTLLMALVPPLTALIGWLALGESLGPLDLAGMALTLAGVVVVILERKEDEAGRRKLPVRGLLLGLGGALGQAVGLVMSKHGMQGFSPFASTQIRVIAGIAGFTLIFAVIGWWPRVLSAIRDSRAMTRTALGAVFGPFLGVSLSLVAVSYTKAGVAATLMALSPVIILAPACLVMKERVSLRAIGGAVVAVAGTALLFL